MLEKKLEEEGEKMKKKDDIKDDKNIKEEGIRNRIKLAN